MNGLPYYKRYPRDFLDGTVLLPFEVKGAYAIILDLIYLQGGKLPDDSRYIAGHLGVSVRKWNSLRQSLLDFGKLKITGEFLTNYRSDKETEILRSFQDKQSENASRPRKNKHLPKAMAKPKVSHTESDTDTEEANASSSIPRKRGSRLPEDWVLPKDWGDWALGEGWAEPTVRLEAEKFRDFWISKSGRDAAKLDWQATWRNWMRNTAKGKINGRKQDGSAADMARRAGERFAARGVDSGPGDDPSQPLLPARQSG